VGGPLPPCVNQKSWKGTKNFYKWWEAFKERGNFCAWDEKRASSGSSPINVVKSPLGGKVRRNGAGPDQVKKEKGHRLQKRISVLLKENPPATKGGGN